MKLRLESLHSPIIVVSIVLCLNKELRLSTIKSTTGLSNGDLIKALTQLTNAGLIDILGNNNENPTYRILDVERTKRYLSDQAKINI